MVLYSAFGGVPITFGYKIFVKELLDILTNPSASWIYILELLLESLCVGRIMRYEG
jgi:hypothetical protein